MTFSDDHICTMGCLFSCDIEISVNAYISPK
jgi:hypothetical protein